jgi:hypothetical protein
MLRVILILNPKIVYFSRLVLIQFYFLEFRWVVQFWILHLHCHRNYHVAHQWDFWLLSWYLGLSESSFWMRTMHLCLRAPFIPAKLLKSPIKCRGVILIHILIQISRGKKFILPQTLIRHSFVYRVSFVRFLVIKRGFIGIRPTENR